MGERLWVDGIRVAGIFFCGVWLVGRKYLILWC